MAEPAAPIGVAVHGLGRAGRLVAGLCLDDPRLTLSGAVVTSAGKDGLDVSELIDRPAIGVRATRDVETIASDPAVDAVVYCGMGSPAEVAEILGRYAERGKDCVTVTGLVHPITALGEAGAARLDARARAGGGRVVGAGWNPGFLLDLLPVVWGQAVPGVRRVLAERVCDLAAWGDGVLDHLGVGTSTPPESWTEHLPVEECVRLVGDALDLGLDGVEPRFDPVLAEVAREARGRRVEPGTIVGFRAFGVGLRGEEEVVTLGWNCRFALDPTADGLRDSARLVIEGDTQVETVAIGSALDDGYPGTAARAVGALRGLRALDPGLYRPDQVPATAR